MNLSSAEFAQRVVNVRKHLTVTQLCKSFLFVLCRINLKYADQQAFSNR